MTERGILRHALDITTSKEKCLISNTKHLVLFRMLQTYIKYSKSLALYIRNRRIELQNWPRTPQTGMSSVHECSIYDSSSISRASQTGRRE